MTYAVTSSIASASDFRGIGISTSSDGRYIAYIDNLGGIVPSMPQRLIKIVDTLTGTTRALGVQGDAATGDLQMGEPMLSGDGQSVVFTLSDRFGENFGIAHVDLRTGTMTEVSKALDGPARGGKGELASVSDDGRYVAFQSSSSNLVSGDTNNVSDIFVMDIRTGSLRRVSTDAAGGQLASASEKAIISGDGKSVLFGTHVKHLDTGVLQEVSTLTNGAAIPGGIALDISRDGHYALVAAPLGINPDAAALYRKDLLSGETVLVTDMARALSTMPIASLSDDGQRVVFSYEHANPDQPVPPGPVYELMLRDLATGGANAVTAETGEGWGVSHFAFSGDGAHVAYIDMAPYQRSAVKVMLQKEILTSTLLPDAAAQPTTTLASETYLPQQGDQRVDGGAGLDTAIYRGKAAEYAVSAGPDGIALVDRQALRDGADQLQGIERIRFSDSALAFDTGKDGHAGQAFRLYQAAFDRAGDPGGLGYWIERLDAGYAVKQLAAGFMDTQEFSALYGAAPSNAQLVERLYQHVLHRPGDAGGIAYWNDMLDRKVIDQADVLASFADSAENIAALVGVVDHGIVYQPAYALW